MGYVRLAFATTSLFIMCFILGVRAEERVKSLPTCNFPAIYNFGDSNSDTGGISAAFYPAGHPCGETFFHKPAGRGSDGRLIIDFIAEHLGLPYLNAYLDSLGMGYRHGANFATGSSTIRPDNESFSAGGPSPFSLDIQTVQFTQFKSRSTDLFSRAGHKFDRRRLPTPKEFAKALYTFDIGQNDIARALQKLNHDQLQAAITDMINQLATAIHNVYEQGGRTFWIHNTGPIGCLPVTTHYFHNPPPGILDENGCVKEQNDVAVEFNRKLKWKVVELRQQLPDAALVYVDVYAAKFGLIGGAKAQGFTDPNNICCGYHFDDTHVYCGHKGMVNGSEFYAGSCEDPWYYISWDGVHYTDAANHWIANHIINASKSLPPTCEFPAIYNFGDSNSDTGGISAAFSPILAPYGEAFFHRPAGRDSDGRLIVDFIAERLKLPYLSAYLNSIGTNYRHGANFATGGSTITKPNETIYEYGISPFFLGMQIQQFDQFKSRTADLYKQVKNSSDAGKLPRAEDYSKALYTFDIGQNDLSMGFRKMSFDQLKAAIPDIVNQLAHAVQHLYEQGGRAFWIHNTGPVGCLPVNLFYVSNPPPSYLDEHGCVRAQNDMAVVFNDVLKDRVVKLRTELPEAAIRYVDVHSAKLGLISNAKSLGLADPLKVCCGYHVKFDHIWCGNKGMVNNTKIYGGSCKDPSKFISWDGVHYTEFANKWVADHTQNGSLADPPIPITLACHRQ